MTFKQAFGGIDYVLVNSRIEIIGEVFSAFICSCGNFTFLIYSTYSLKSHFVAVSPSLKYIDDT